MRKIYYLCIGIYVLQAVTVLVRDVKYYKIETSQLQVLMTFCEEDLHDYNRQSTAFSLLKVTEIIIIILCQLDLSIIIIWVSSLPFLGGCWNDHKFF